MDRLLKINGKSVKAAKFDLNLMCDFEDSGIEIEDISKKMFNVIRQYVASSMGISPKEAGLEISAHIENGGDLEDISEVMTDEMQDSGFFRPKQTDKKKDASTRTRKKKAEEIADEVSVDEIL